MIVKNESAIIRSTLENITQYLKLSYWVISDTGSTDGTQDIIKKFFEERKIPGELYEDKWQNFGFNRTLALKEAYNKSDYILLFDADDAFRGDFKLPKLESTLSQNKKDVIDRISCKFGNGDDFCWYRPSFLNNRIKWKYVGVLHEYIEIDEPGYEPSSINLDGEYYIEARTIGGDRNKDDKKYYKDAILLEKALHEETDPGLKARYTFYCAQSFRDYLDFPNAIKYYMLRTTQGSFDEEIHVSYFNAGRMMIFLSDKQKSEESPGKVVYTEADIEKTLMDGWNFMRDRSECLYELSKYFRLKGNYAKAYLYASIGAKIPFPKHRVLFLHKDVYKWRLKDELAICSFYLGKYNESIIQNQKILRGFYEKRIIDNMKFSVNEVLKKVLIKSNRNINFTKPVGANRLLGLTLVLHFKDSVDFVKIFINSLFHHVKDLYKVERFIILMEDKFSEKQKEILAIYPFFEFVTWKHPSHILPNLKSKLNKFDRFIFYCDDAWISIVEKNYFDKALICLTSNKTFGQFIYNRVQAENIDAYAQKMEGILVHSPKSVDEDQEKKYFYVEKFTNPATCPVIFRREFLDVMNSFDKPVEEPMISVFQNAIDFVRIKRDIKI
jgi:hypothetical protein